MVSENVGNLRANPVYIQPMFEEHGYREVEDIPAGLIDKALAAAESFCRVQIELCKFRDLPYTVNEMAIEADTFIQGFLAGHINDFRFY